LRTHCVVSSLINYSKLILFLISSAKQDLSEFLFVLFDNCMTVLWSFVFQMYRKCLTCLPLVVTNCNGEPSLLKRIKNKKVSYCKQIARQHSSHKFWSRNAVGHVSVDSRKTFLSSILITIWLLFLIRCARIHL